MTRSGDRLRAIEQELRELKARLKHAERQQVSSSPLSLFWGQTWTPVEGDYPESPANCLPVVPIDYKFTEEVGPQEGTVERQREVPIQPALAPSHIPRETTVLVMRDRQQKQNHILIASEFDPAADHNTITILNTSSETILKSHGVALRPNEISGDHDFESRPYNLERAGQWVVALEDIAPNEKGKALASGVIKVPTPHVKHDSWQGDWQGGRSFRYVEPIIPETGHHSSPFAHNPFGSGALIAPHSTAEQQTIRIGQFVSDLRFGVVQTSTDANQVGTVRIRIGTFSVDVFARNVAPSGSSDTLSPNERAGVIFRRGETGTPVGTNWNMFRISRRNLFTGGEITVNDGDTLEFNTFGAFLGHTPG